jgi:hypothetical protein
MNKLTIRSIPVLAVLLLLGASWVVATEDLAKQQDMKCTQCHDKAGSKLLTDEGVYFESMGTMEGYDQVKSSFGKCTTCHVRKPGSTKLTKKGKELASVVDGMEELREWLKENHPETKPEDK